MHAEYYLWVSTMVNGPAKADDSQIIMVNSCVAFGCTNRSGSVEVALIFTRFHVVKRDRNCGLLHLNLLSHLT